MPGFIPVSDMNRFIPLAKHCESGVENGWELARPEAGKHIVAAI